MKLNKALAFLTASTALMTVSVPFSASADEAYLYGTMEIPYADFYKAELDSASNAYEVDAVSSATSSKWTKNGEAELFEGSYHGEPAEDGSGQILGVIYPVAITQETLDALGENKYNFTPLSETPEAYKIVTVTDGKAEFSAVNDAEPETFEPEIKLSTETPYGDYLMTFDSVPETMGAVYGAVLYTADGNAYAMRHEQNLWRGQIAWSSGIKTTEPHGNVLDYEDYASLMGKTVSKVVLIGKSGYYTATSDVYVPVKFENTLEIPEGEAGTGTVTISKTGFPEDYQAQYQIAENFSVNDDVISYTDALAGSYTMTISDAGEKYADVSANFVLNTENLPVAYDAENKKLIPAEGFTEEEAANFLKNLSKVKVNEKEYSASGKGAVSIVDTADGTIKTDAVSGRGDTAAPVFASDADNTVTVTATGYSTPLTFTIKSENEPAETTTTTTTTTSATSTTTTTTATSNTNSKSNSSNNSNNNSTAKSSAMSSTVTNTSSPKTGDPFSAVPLALLTALGLSALTIKKKK